MIHEGQIAEIMDKMHILYAQNPYMGRKVRTTILINEELKKLAEEFGINLSAFVELKLFEHFRELVLMKEQNKLVLRPGFEPGSRDRESRMIGRATPPELNPATPIQFITFLMGESDVQIWN